MKIFKFDRFGWLVLFAFLASIPGEAIYQLIANGAVDWWRLGQGRIKFPFWLTLSFVFPAFLYLLFFSIVPAVTAMLRGYEFKLDGDILVVCAHPIPRDTIQSVRKSRLGGLLLKQRTASSSDSGQNCLLAEGGPSRNGPANLPVD